VPARSTTMSVSSRAPSSLETSPTIAHASSGERWRGWRAARRQVSDLLNFTNSATLRLCRAIPASTCLGCSTI
jgi:hypothetical protein